MSKEKSKNLQMRELKADLHYWQMQARFEARNLKATIKKIKLIGEKLRELQRSQNERPNES